MFGSSSHHANGLVFEYWPPAYLPSWFYSGKYVIRFNSISTDSFFCQCFDVFRSHSLLTYVLLSWVGLSKALHLAATMFVCPHIFLLPFPSVNWIFQARPGRSYWVGLRQNPSPTPKQTFHCWIINIGPFTTTLTYASAIADDAGADDDDRNYNQIEDVNFDHPHHRPLCGSASMW